MSACISDALAQLRRAHPQWGWAIGDEAIKGELSAKGSSGKVSVASAHIARQGAAWCVTLSASKCDWKGYDDTPLGAFNRARDNAGGRW